MYEQLSADPARDDLLILVDGLDRTTGYATKEETHRKGLLHRAFSVVLLRENGRELLLSRRAESKYHAAGLWANACCSHPRKDETIPEAARRRLREELGCAGGSMREIGAFVYRAGFPDGLWEYEYDHVLLGYCQGTVRPSPEEVSEVRWISREELASCFQNQPELFAPWAFMVLSMAMQEME